VGSKNRLPAPYVVLFIFGAATAPVANTAPPDAACALVTETQVGAVLGVSGCGFARDTYELKTVQLG
jgi:hypothetical protein